MTDATDDGKRAAGEIVAALQDAWNTADGRAFAAWFADDADFVNIRGDHLRTREVIAQGHQHIFDTIYKGSTVRYILKSARPISPDVVLAHVTATLNAPSGPLAGEHHSLFSAILVRASDGWRIASFHNTLVAR